MLYSSSTPAVRLSAGVGFLTEGLRTRGFLSSGAPRPFAAAQSGQMVQAVHPSSQKGAVIAFSHVVLPATPEVQMWVNTLWSFGSVIHGMTSSSEVLRYIHP